MIQLFFFAIQFMFAYIIIFFCLSAIVFKTHNQISRKDIYKIFSVLLTLPEVGNVFRFDTAVICIFDVLTHELLIIAVFLVRKPAMRARLCTQDLFSPRTVQFTTQSLQSLRFRHQHPQRGQLHRQWFVLAIHQSGFHTLR